MAGVLSQAGLQAIADEIAAGSYSTAYLKLSKADWTPSVDTVIGDVEEADFDGYVGQQIAWDGTAWDAGLEAAKLIALAATEWENVGIAAQDIYGVYLTDVTGSVYLWGEKDPGAPVSVGPSDTYSYLPEIDWSN